MEFGNCERAAKKFASVLPNVPRPRPSDHPHQVAGQISALAHKGFAAAICHPTILRAATAGVGGGWGCSFGE